MKDKHQTVEPAGVSEERRILSLFRNRPATCRPRYWTTARQQLAEMRADAVRYRWLREHRDVSLITDFFGNGCVNKTVEMVDAATTTPLSPPPISPRGGSVRRAAGSWTIHVIRPSTRAHRSMLPTARSPSGVCRDPSNSVTVS
jgi:hypothetical protein